VCESTVGGSRSRRNPGNPHPMSRPTVATDQTKARYSRTSIEGKWPHTAPALMLGAESCPVRPAVRCPARRISLPTGALLLLAIAVGDRTEGTAL
jgi:hypothetical protein